MTRLLSFFGGWQGYLIGAALCIALGAYGMHRWDAGQTAIKEVTVYKDRILLSERQVNISYKVSADFEGVKASNQKNTENLLDEVEVHVSPQIDIGHPVPCGFVRLFNASAHDPVPDAACGSDDASSGIALSAVAKATVQNNGLYDQCASQLGALQEWIRQQQQAAKGP